MIHQFVFCALCVYTMQGCSPTIGMTGMASSLQEVCTANRSKSESEIPLALWLTKNEDDISCSEKEFHLTGVEAMVYRLEASFPKIIPKNYKRSKISDNGNIVVRANTNRIFGIGAEVNFTDGVSSQQIVVFVENIVNSDEMACYTMFQSFFSLGFLEESWYEKSLVIMHSFEEERVYCFALVCSHIAVAGVPNHGFHGNIIVGKGFFVRSCVGIRSENSGSSCSTTYDQLKKIFGYEFNLLPCGNRTFYYNESICNTTEMVKCHQSFKKYDDGQCFNGSVVYSQRKQILSNTCDFKEDFSITNSGIWTRNGCTAEFEVCTSNTVYKVSDKHVAAIRCLSNCGVLTNPQEKIEVYLDCKSCTSEIQNYDWYTAECGSSDVGSCGSNRTYYQQYTDTRFLTVTHNDSLLPPYFQGMFVTAHFEDGSHSEASLMFQYSPIPTPGECNISPSTGYALLTDFNITCANFSVSSGLNLTYTIYANTQNTTNKALRLYKGRKSFTQGVKLQEGLPSYNHMIYIFVKASVDSGASTEIKTAAQVFPPNEADSGVDTIDLVFDMAVKNENNGSSQIEDLFNTGNAEAAVQLIGIISSTLNSMNVSGDNQLKEKKTETRAAMVSSLEQVTENVPDFETLLTVTAVLNDATGVKSELSGDTQEKSTKLYDSLAESLDSIINQTTSKMQVEDTATTILQGVTGILDLVTDRRKTELSSNTEHFSQRDGNDKADSSSVVKMRNSTGKLLQVVNKVGGSILTQQLVDQPPTVIQTDTLTISVQKLASDKLTNITLSPADNLQSSSSSIKFEGSPPILGDDIGVKIIGLQKNPYVWDSSASDVNSEVLSVELLDTEKAVMKVDNLTTPVKIAFKIPKTNDEINTTLHLTLEKDNETIIYDSSMSNLITFNFTLIKDKTAVLRVTSTSIITDFKMLISDQASPSLEDVLKSGFSYPTESHFQTQYTNFTLSGQNISAILRDVNEGLLYFHYNSSSMNITQTIYVGISVDINNTDTLHQLKQADSVCLGNTIVTTCSSQMEVPISLETKSLSCTYWDENEQVWSNKGCEVSPHTTTSTLQCACTHLTLFTGRVFVLPSDVDQNGDAALFLTIVTNPLVVTAVIVVSFCYTWPDWLMSKTRDKLMIYTILIMMLHVHTAIWSMLSQDGER